MPLGAWLKWHGVGMGMWMWNIPDSMPRNKKNTCEKQKERRMDELEDLGVSLQGKRMVEGGVGVVITKT